MPDLNKIFKFNLNGVDTYFDPFEVDYNLGKASEHEDMGVINSWLDLPKKEDGTIDEEKLDVVIQRNYIEAVHRLYPIVLKAFKLTPIDPKTGEGIDGETAMDLWASYLEWQAGIKKNIENQPISATSTATPGTSSPSAGST